jgi:hypothetical protein
MKREHGQKSSGHDTATMRFSMASTVAVADINFEDCRADARAGAIVLSETQVEDYLPQHFRKSTKNESNFEEQSG